MKKIEKRKTRKIRRILLVASLTLLLILIIGFTLYLGDYYHATENALDLLNTKESSVLIKEKKHQIVMQPEEPVAGLIFYPGGKVQYEAYAPLMEAFAQKGILCVLVHMPGNLAVFDMDAAQGIQEEYPEIQDWYIGGHSLGGAMAASYVSKHTAEYKGLILLAAYSTADLGSSNLKVLSVYGSMDGVMNREKYRKYSTNLPAGFTESIIEGGCHAYFGSYGAQDGDGTPTISNDEQIRQTADIVSTFFMN